ncbi:MAG: deoxyribose-phosphate aldolase [Bacteroidales bacterium]|nr:deoxyribose-phosphate aldolase [Bacteroidales bacterium]
MNLIKKYGYEPKAGKISAALDVIASNIDSMESTDKLYACFSCMDLTTLSASDTKESVTKLVEKVNALPENYPSFPLPASVCVYPNFASVVKGAKKDAALHVTTVAGAFPSSQSFKEVKVLESRMAVRNGADEVDIVLALNAFLAGDEQAAADEISAIRAAIDEEGAALGKKVVLKVIIESGLLVSEEKIAEASLLSMEAGADFIKTSTGKVEVNATPTAAYVMCECIRKYYEATGRKVGFKAAGGISNAKDALCYYLIVSTLLGEEWLGKDLFRLGVSRLGNSLMSAVLKETVQYF